MWNSLRVRLTVIFIGLAIGPLLLVGLVLARRTFTFEREQALDLQHQIAQRVATEMDAFLREVETDLRLLSGQVWSLEQPDRAQQISILLSAFSSGPYRDVYEEFTLLDAQGQEQLRLSRLEIVSSGQLGDRSDADEFKDPKASRKTYFSPIRFDEIKDESLMTIAIPVSELRSIEVSKVLVADLHFKAVGDLIATLPVDEDQTIYIVNSENKVVAHQEPALALVTVPFELPEQGDIRTGLDGTEVVLAVDRVTLGEQELTIVVERPASEALKLANNTVFTLITTIVIALVIAGALGFLIVGQVVRPLESLAATARAISAGDFQQQVAITRGDEVGDLAGAFNTMTAQLQELISSLEERVADRTQRLEIVATLGQRLGAILDFDQLLFEMVDQVKERFGYYHAHVYIIDDDRKNLVMSAGTGQAGLEMKATGHHIPLNTPTSLVARAARTREIVNVDNVRETEGWLPNPLLPDTYSEMAVPITLGLEGDVVGVLDVQEDKIAGFDEGDVNLLRSLANQVAVAIRNAQLFQEVETALAEAHAAQARYISQSWAKARITAQGGTYHYARTGAPVLDEMALEKAKERALTVRLPALVTLDDPENTEDNEDGPSNPVSKTQTMSGQGSHSPKSIVAPITLHNQPIGALQVHPAQAGQTWTEEDLAIVAAVIDQLGQTAESLRLFDEAQARAARERTLREITDKLRAAPNLDQLVALATEELGQRLAVTHAKLELGFDVDEVEVDEERGNRIDVTDRERV